MNDISAVVKVDSNRMKNCCICVTKALHQYFSNFNMQTVPCSLNVTPSVLVLKRTETIHLYRMKFRNEIYLTSGCKFIALI